MICEVGMKTKSEANSVSIISEIVGLECAKLPVLTVESLSAINYEIEILEQEIADLPEGRQKEWCKEHLKYYQAKVSNHVKTSGLQ